MSEPPDGRRPLATALLFLASLALVLGVAELGTRLLWQPPVPRQPEIPDEWRDLPKLKGIFQLARPNVRGLFGGVLFETNSAGFRGPERSLEKPPGVFRIVVTGDSVAMGSGVLAEDTYAAGLERALAGRDGPRRFEVLDIGLGGINAGQAIGRLESLGLPYDPDLVIYGYTLNDVEGPHYRRTRQDSFLHSLRFADSPFYLVRALGPRWLSLQELVWPPRGSYIYELDDNYLRNPAAWDDVTSALDRFASLAGERGICAVLFLHTRLNFLHVFHPFKRLYARVGSAARARGIHVVPSFHRFRGWHAAELWVSAFDPHPNRDGHELLKQALLEGLEKLPGSCWRGPSPFAEHRDARPAG